jgi:S-adenosylmethionine:tRNA ribosyltransferase-isomerase
VFNDSRVRHARLYARAESSGNAAEFLLVARARSADYPEGSVWKAMVRNAKRHKAGRTYGFDDGTSLTIVELSGESLEGTEFRHVAFSRPIDDDWLDRMGHMPLPPYIKREDELSDAERYQTVYARSTGSVAAPTAGLHFTPEVLASLDARGIERVSVTLHVGLGTFLPVRVDRIEDHRMHEEPYSIEESVALRVTEAKRSGRPVVAIGTTSVRTLESAWDDAASMLRSGESATSIFIYPSYRFRVVDSLFTNFHTPESTLLMLVSAFAGRERILSAYEHAVRERYRFFSYGDSMLIL